MINWIKNVKNEKSKDIPSPSPAPFLIPKYPSTRLLILPLSLIPLVAYSYNVLMPAVVMAIVAFCSSITIIPLSSHCLARVGLRGRDLLKPYKQLVWVWKSLVIPPLTPKKPRISRHCSGVRFDRVALPIHPSFLRESPQNTR